MYCHNQNAKKVKTNGKIEIWGKKMEIKLGNISDIDGWMDLVEKVKEGFPGLETTEALSEHRNTVLEFINKESAICAKSCNKL